MLKIDEIMIPNKIIAPENESFTVSPINSGMKKMGAFDEITDTIALNAMIFIMIFKLLKTVADLQIPPIPDFSKKVFPLFGAFKFSFC